MKRSRFTDEQIAYALRQVEGGTAVARMRCSKCGKKAAEIVAVARPRPRGVPKNPH